VADAITDVAAWSRALPLPRPLRIGPMTVARREYALVRVTCASGAVGEAYAQSRGAPVPEVVERLFAPVLAGADATDVAGRVDDLERATLAVGRVGLVRRALSLVDLALHDAAGRRAGTPVHALLGRPAAPVAVTYVAGYPATARLAVDANWVWRTPDEAAGELRGWPLERLAWVEDPFVPEDLEALAGLRRRVTVPVAAGDELADPAGAVRLLDAGVDVLRLDVATIGGLRAAADLVERAAARGTPVSLHISPESSIHVATGNDAVLDIETFDRAGNPFDPSHELVKGGPAFTGGVAVPADRPGLGFTLR